MGALGEGGGEHLHLPGRDQVVEEWDPSGGALRMQWGRTPQLTRLEAPPGTRREQLLPASPAHRRTCQRAIRQADGICSDCSDVDPPLGEVQAVDIRRPVRSVSTVGDQSDAGVFC